MQTGFLLLFEIFSYFILFAKYMTTLPLPSLEIPISPNHIGVQWKL